jgi:type VI secretion system protein ImpE
MALTAAELFKAGDLNGAVTAGLDAVKKNPSDANARVLLCELLCFSGDLEKIDKQLDALGTLQPEKMIPLGLFRQLLRAEEGRRQFHADGRIPEFLTKPNDLLQQYLQSSILIRENKLAEAAEALNKAEETRPRVSGTCNGKPFNDFRDLDDLLGPCLEVLTSTGKYYWVPFESIELLEFEPPATVRDLYFRPTHLIVRDGPDGQVFVPALYNGAHTHTDGNIRLGRVTDWVGGEGSPVRGHGLRELLVGDDPMTILELKSLSFDGPAESPAPAPAE